MTPRRKRSPPWPPIPAASSSPKTTISTLGLEQARDDIGSYYILGYYSTNAKTDGKYRTVNVKLNRADVAGAKLDYRHGYFADKEFGKFTAADKDDQLQQALILGDPHHRSDAGRRSELLPARARSLLRPAQREDSRLGNRAREEQRQREDRSRFHRAASRHARTRCRVRWPMASRSSWRSRSLDAN